MPNASLYSRPLCKGALMKEDTVLSTKAKPSSAVTFFVLSVLSLAGLFLEAPVLQGEQFIYNKKYFQFTITESIVHWVLICFIWGIIGALLMYVSSRVYKFDLTKADKKPSMSGMAVTVLLLAAAVLTRYFVWDGWKIAQDFHRSGWFQSIFQYIYYLFEVLLVLLTVAFAQECGDRAFKTKYVPWGGILLALTWGLSHIITQGDLVVGLSYALYSILFGIAFLCVKKNIYISYPVIVLMFCL